MNIEPVYDHVLIKNVIQYDKNEDCYIGIVCALPELMSSIEVGIGDKVVFSKYTATHFDNFYIVNSSKILAVIYEEED